MKVNIRQISENTGFSSATVSNALNGKPGVNATTAEIICKEAERLGYILQNKLSKLKFVTYHKNGKILDDSLFFPAVIEGVEKQAKISGFETTFIRLNYRDSTFDAQINEILADTASVVILLATEMNEEDIALFAQIKCPLLLLDGWSDKMQFDGVLINSTDAVCGAMEYLIANGHKEIGYIRSDERIKAFTYREFGYLRGLAKYNLKVEDQYLITVGSQPESAYEMMKKYLEKEPKMPTAFFVDNDGIALGAMRALQERGYKIPDDISIVGFDDLPMSAISNPPLTTIHVYKHNMGEVAVRTILDSYENNNEAKKKIEVCGKLVIRQSVKNLRE